MLALVLFAAMGQVQGAAPSLEKLLERVPEAARSSDGGISTAGEELSAQFRALGPAAIPRLLSLLENPDEDVREFAGFTLTGISGLGEEHLDLLIESCESGNGWVPSAIGSIRSARAIEYLIGNLRRAPRGHTQVTWGLVKSGEPAAAALARVFEERAPVSEAFARCTEQVLDEMGERSIPAIDILFRAAADRSLLPANRALAVEVLGSIRLPARRVIPGLQALARAEPDLFSEAVETAIIEIGGPEAAQALALRLADYPAVWTLRDIAALHEHGGSAGSAVLQLLSSPDPDIRVAAIRTLGYIGCLEATDPLVRVLMDGDDWMLAQAAAESLGRLRAARAVPTLGGVARTYWYPPVCETARKAIRAILGYERYSPRFHPRNFAFDFFYDLGEERARIPHVAVAGRVAEPDALAGRELRRNPYTLESAGQEPGERAKPPRKQTAACGLRVDGGLLLGSNRGEWGGEVVFLRPGGAQEKVLDENIVGLHKTPQGIVAVTGLAHLMLEQGALYRIERQPDGTFQANWWKRLPGVPSGSYLLADGALVVDCRGGTITVSANGVLAMARSR